MYTIAFIGTMSIAVTTVVDAADVAARQAAAQAEQARIVEASQEWVSLERAKIKLEQDKALLNLEKAELKTLLTMTEAEEKKQLQRKANQEDFLERSRELMIIREEEFAREKRKYTARDEEALGIRLPDQPAKRVKRAPI
jgi:hypothetical protein